MKEGPLGLPCQSTLAFLPQGVYHHGGKSRLTPGSRSVGKFLEWVAKSVVDKVGRLEKGKRMYRRKSFYTRRSFYSTHLGAKWGLLLVLVLLVAGGILAARIFGIALPEWATSILLSQRSASDLQRSAFELSGDGTLAASAPAGDTTTPPPSQFDIVAESISYLQKAGWTKEAAKAVVELNARYLRLIWESDRSAWEDTLLFWARLGGKSEVLMALENHPELASLLAGSLEADPDAPLQILKTLPDHPEKRDLVLSLYALYPDPQAIVQWTRILEQEPTLILDLLRGGHPELIPFLTILPEDLGEAAPIYSQWVRDVIQWGEARSWQGDPYGWGRSLSLLVIHAPTVASQLRSDPEFRRNFLESYWPEFLRILESRACVELPVDSGKSREEGQSSAGQENPATSGTNPSSEGSSPQGLDQDLDEREEEEIWTEVFRHSVWLAYAGDPRVWAFFHSYRKCGHAAFQAFEEFSGMAVELGLAPEYQDVKDRVFEALRTHDELVLFCLQDEELRRNPLFVRLLARPIPPSVLAHALSTLAARKNESGQLLQYWAQLSDAALVEELGPQPSGPITWIPLYGILNVARKVYQGREVTFGDIVWAAGDVAVFLPMGGLTGQGAKLAARGLGGAAKATSQVAARSLGKAALRATGRAGTRSAAKTLALWGVPRITRQLSAQSGGNITPILEATDEVFRSLGIPSSSIPVLQRFEMNILLKGGRVFFTPATRSAIGYLLRETAESGLAEGIGNLAGDFLDDMNARWRESLSLWWTAYYTGQIDKLASEFSKLEPPEE
jgi:hypothetical protein